MPSPKIPTIASPKLYDLAISKFNTRFASRLTWLNYCFGKCQILKKGQGRKTIVYPAVYSGQNIEGEYQNVLPDEELGNTSFFILPDPKEIQWKGNIKGILESKFSLLIWYNLKEVLNDPTQYRNTDLILLQVMDAFRYANRGFRGEMTIDRVYDMTAENIYKEFTISEIQQQFLQYPFGGMRIDGKIKIFEDCPYVVAAQPDSFTLSNATSDGFTGTVIQTGDFNGHLWQYSTDEETWIDAGTTTTELTFDYTGLAQDTEYFARAISIGDINSDPSEVQSISTLLLYEPEAQAWFDRMTDPTEIQKQLADAFIVSEKAAGNDYDEFFFTGFGGVNGLVGFKSKTATEIGTGHVYSNAGLALDGAGGLNSNFDLNADKNLYDLNDGQLAVFLKKIPAYDNSAKETYIGCSAGSEFSELAVTPTDRHLRSINGTTNVITGSFEYESSSLYTTSRVAASGSGALLTIKSGVEILSTIAVSTSIPVGTTVGIGCEIDDGLPEHFAVGTISTAMIGPGIGFDHVSHSNNVRKLIAGNIAQKVITDLDIANAILYSQVETVELATAIETFVTAAKTAGQWDNWADVMLPMLGEDSGIYWLKGNGTASENGGITWGDNWVEGNGTDAYLGLGVSMDDMTTQNDAVISVFVREYRETSGAHVLLGATADSGETNTYLQMIHGTGGNALVNSSSTAPVAGEFEDNTIITSTRTGGSTNDLYYDDVDQDQNNRSSGNPSTRELYALALNNGSDSQHTDASIYAIIVGSGVGYDVAASNAIIRQLETDLEVVAP